MFDHSIKVPRLYKTASKIAKSVSEGRGSIKQLVYESKHPNIKALYALIVHTFQRTTDIESLLKKSKLLIKEPRFDPWLAKILITELLWGKKRLSSQAKPIKTILAYEQIFKAHLSDVSNVEELQQVDKPRYVRINTLKISVNEAIDGFRDEGWILKRFTDQNYINFLDAVSTLGPEEFMIDLHVPYLLIFPPKTHFYRHPAYKNGSIILQDKASCFPAHILSPEPNSTVLDMCAAPGMKTTQCAAIMGNSGKVYAVEIGKKRFQTLGQIIEAAEATCVEAINADVLTITGDQYPDVEYVLVDPSCSGSGITDRVEIGQQEIDQHRKRLEKLAGFQIKILRHALTRFPKVKRVVYSTCSVYAEENEDVVRQVLETCNRFKLVPANQFVGNKWHNFGSSEFGELGNYCLYARPDVDLTSGFFVAVFERLEEGESNQFLNRKLFQSIKRRGGRKRDDEAEEDIESKNHDFATEKKKKKRKNENQTDYVNIGVDYELKEEGQDIDDSKEKIKIEKQFSEDISVDDGCTAVKRKKKKKSKAENVSVNSQVKEEVEDMDDLKEKINIEKQLSKNRSFDDECTAIKRKKKNKNKAENVIVDSQLKEEVEDIDDTNGKIKIEDNIPDNTSFVNEDTTRKKRKKKKDKSHTNFENIDVDFKIKKQDFDKEKLVKEEIPKQFSNLNDIEENNSKKKKKKKRQEDNNDEIEGKKKRNQKKIDELNEVEDENSFSTPAKKKKKKNT